MKHLITTTLLLLATSAGWSESIIRLQPGDDPQTSEAVLFPFDSYSLPYRHGVELTLVPASKKGPVLLKGARALGMERIAESLAGAAA